MSITVRAPAKINLHLAVGPRQQTEGGYHPLMTVYQAIGLYDDVTVQPAADWSVSVASVGDVDVEGVPLDNENIAIRAGLLLASHHGLDRRAQIDIAKGIPVAGGMAGGSADAAATLVALDRLWDAQTSDEDLLALAADLGSDVPFALLGGTAMGTGRGEVVEPVVDNGSWWWIAVPAPQGLSTPSVYAEFDRLGLGDDLTVPQPLIEALGSGSLEHLAASLHNGLQVPAVNLRPDLDATLDAAGAAGAVAVLLSGSGPTCLCLCRDQEHALRTKEALVDAGFTGVAAAPGPVAGVHLVEYA